MTIYEDVLGMVQQLSPAEKARLLEELSAALLRDLTPVEPPPQPLYGSFSDLGTAPSAEDIDEARHEIWGNFPREDI
jgi:hypothetical protein